jgi:hypothetical protein
LRDVVILRGCEVITRARRRDRVVVRPCEKFLTMSADGLKTLGW